MSPLEYTDMPKAKKKPTLDIEHPPRGVEAVSTREAASILGCSMGHVRKLITRGRLGERGTAWWRVSPRALMIRLKTLESYEAEMGKSPYGRPRGGYAIDR